MTSLCPQSGQVRDCGTAHTIHQSEQVDMRCWCEAMPCILSMQMDAQVKHCKAMLHMALSERHY